MESFKTPDFIIIGAQKCGTSTMFHHLRKHPDIFLPRKKELHFFDENYDKGMEFYLHFFNRKKMPERQFCSGEASPFYFFHPLAASRIYQHFPDIKLILLLRNPINRAYSNYQHQHRKGRISISFEHAIKLEPEILEHKRKAYFEQENHSDLMYRRFSFLARSLYSEQLPAWYQHFSKEQILILKSEDYFKNPTDTFKQVFEFLGVKPFEIILTKEHKKSDYPPMKPETRQQLKEYFEPFNQQLYQLTGRDFGWK
jgi:hypothetical protein